MVKININLIPGEERASFEIGSLVKRIRFIAVFILICFIILLISVFFLYFKLGSQKKELSEKMLQTENKIKAYRTREANLFVLKDRLDLAQKVISSRSENLDVLVKLDQIVLNSINFEQAESKGKGSLSITVSSPDLLAINRFLAAISDPEFTKDFKKLEASSITRSEKGIYSFILEAEKILKT